jgi:TRAP-type C4-dicarboxylate transport system substrate-binding protein
LPVYSRADLSRIAALVGAPLLAVSTSAVAREFRAADTRSEDYPTVQALHHMGALTAERSGGRIQLRVFHSDQLGAEIEQTRVGAIDLNRANVALIGNFVAATKVLAMPSLYRSIERLEKVLVEKVLEGPTGNEILGGFDPYGFAAPAIHEPTVGSDQCTCERGKGLEDRSREQAKAAGAAVMTDSNRKPFEAAMAGIDTGAQRDPADAGLTERIRKVE